MKYICYMEKDRPETLVKLEYSGTQDPKLIAALTFIISKGSMGTSLSIIVDAIEGDLQVDKIFELFDEHCIIIKDDIKDILSKDIVTVADLFS